MGKMQWNVRVAVMFEIVWDLAFTEGQVEARGKI